MKYEVSLLGLIRRAIGRWPARSSSIRQILVSAILIGFPSPARAGPDFVNAFYTADEGGVKEEYRSFCENSKNGATCILRLRLEHVPSPGMVRSIFLVIFFFSALSPFEILSCFLLICRLIAADPHIIRTADRLCTLSSCEE